MSLHKTRRCENSRLSINWQEDLSSKIFLWWIEKGHCNKAFNWWVYFSSTPTLNLEFVCILHLKCTLNVWSCVTIILVTFAFRFRRRSTHPTSKHVWEKEMETIQRVKLISTHWCVSKMVPVWPSVNSWAIFTISHFASWSW